WTDDDLELGSVNGQDYLKEKYPQAFEKIFGSRVGYVHVLPDGSFSSDPRLMPSERISKENVKVEKVKKISDLLKALKQQNKMILARHGDLLPWEREEKAKKKTAASYLSAQRLKAEKDIQEDENYKITPCWIKKAVYT